MTKKLVIFGVGNIAELAHYYFTQDSDYQVCGFTVDRDYLTQDEFCGLPVVAFDEVVKIFPIDEFDLFIALSYSKLNLLRQDRYLAAKNMGYNLPSYISSHATVLNDGKIGENCFILEDNTIQPFVVIGNNITLWSGNHIGHHSTIKDHVFIASHVVVSGGVEIGERCFIGVNATLRDHIALAAGSVIGAGALLLESTQEDSLYIGSRTKQARIPASKLKSL